MKNKKNTWRLFFALCIFLYTIAIVVSVLIVRNVPSMYVDLQQKENYKIDEIVKKASISGSNKEYEKILDKYLTDFVVYNESTKKIEFSSINIDNNINLFEKNVNEKLVSSKKKMNVQRGDENLSLFVVEYYVSPQKTFDIWVIALIFIEAILLSIITVSLIILFYKYVKPLGRLKSAVQNISAFQLNMIDNVKKSSEYDNLTAELYDFSQQLDERIKETGYKYSELEQSLIIQNEEVSYRNKVVGSLAHDLKAPLSLINLNLEKMKTNNNEQDIDNVQEKVNNVIIDINSLNKVAFNTSLVSEEKNQEIDLIELILDSFEAHKELFESKGLFIEFDLCEELNIKKNRIRVKQLVDNLFTNIYNHAKEDGDVEIECYLEKDNVVMSFYNDADNISEESIKNMTNLFYSESNNLKNSGIGMYTVKLISEELKADLDIHKENEGIIIKVVFPYE